MVRIRCFTLAVLLPVIISCGQMINSTGRSCSNERFTASPASPVLTHRNLLQSTPTEAVKVLILPFADYTPYTYGFSQPDYWKRNALILEALQDGFDHFGFLPAIMDDVIGYLFANNIIVAMNRAQTPDVSISMATQSVLLSYASASHREARKALKEAAYHNISKSMSKNVEEYMRNKNIPLDYINLQSMSSFFNADYIVRGRIVQYGMEDKDSPNPLQTGILPFIFRVGPRTLVGYSKTDYYEALGSFTMGEFLGRIGSRSLPLITRGMGLSASSSNAFNSFLWAGFDSSIDLMVYEEGKAPKTYVQIGMLVQSAKTGDILWFNSVAVGTSPQRICGEANPSTLYNSAIQQAAASLVEDVVNSGVMGGRPYSTLSPESQKYPRELPKAPVLTSDE
jgi:hypothetical protein